MSFKYWDFRKDLIGLSTESKPTTNVVDGTSYLEVNTSKLFIYYKGTWYEQQ